MLNSEKIYIKESGKFYNVFYDFTKGICLDIKGVINDKVFEKNGSLYIKVKLDNEVLESLKYIEYELINKMSNLNLNIISIFSKNSNSIILKLPSFRGKINGNIKILINDTNISIYDLDTNDVLNIQILLDTLWNFTDNKLMYKWKLKKITS